ncbi:MAG: amidohydrolase family protein [SAR202 cluster bacterium]|jgi:dihydroorotase|nr:amidohydrolase family protein [SAR202 cluster bacterium]
MTKSSADLVIKAGRIFCADSCLDGPGAVAIKSDRIIASGYDVFDEFPDAKQVLSFPDALLIPGLIDLHAHPASAEWFAGIDPDSYILARGTTTALSQGDAGPDTWKLYYDTVIDPARLDIRAAISPVSGSTFAQSGGFEELANIDVDGCIGAVRDGGDSIWGIAVNAMVQVTGPSDPREILQKTLAVAETTQLPLLFGSRREPSDWPLADQLDLLRPGDVMTYCLHSGTKTGEESIVKNGRVLDAVWDAKERGVLFDVGHGMSSFDFHVAEAAITQGFMPDTISTDIQRRHVAHKPQHDMPRVISKLMAAGMPESEVLARSTQHPAKALGLSEEIGTLAAGTCADLAVLHWNPDASPLVDCVGVTRPGGCFEPVMTVRGGVVVS